MVKKRVSKREIVEKHTRARQHRNVSKLKRTIQFTENEETVSNIEAVSDSIEEIIEQKEVKKPVKRSKKAKTEEAKSE